ncbi:acyl-CoA carboxylase subunit epsilon [Saccharomonospora viridis]|uniref:Acyl-CoA carboxylase epsilon subunit n=2 Tax=Saccharomonospora viridis TaxID=1852 RepID=C7MUU6_SACVD|nr:acyl-CoA carboxylase subunit epsilon [Saccharomonospora viridis]ACU95659.1 hypothetical protein Svir_05880 [Saccharomonospora viridis DSM 43017]KHF43871.1 acetyl-CoA carboxylase [Saccharomonospora viridis]SFP91830.1 Acyl-CoA carboxylase epsilon subunit [Saccharomonospora viridis]
MSELTESEPTEPVGGDQNVLLRVVRGAPDDAELAALTAVVAGLTATTRNASTPSPRRSRWADPASRLRLPARPARDGWRASAYPA